jgi:hypothetical protein
MKPALLTSIIIAAVVAATAVTLKLTAGSAQEIAQEPAQAAMQASAEEPAEEPAPFVMQEGMEAPLQDSAQDPLQQSTTVTEAIKNAAEKKNISCTEGFTLSKESGGYRLRGTLEAPTPHYTYEMRPRAGGYSIFIKPIQPDHASSMTVVGSVNVDSMLMLANVRDIDINIEKDFNWGPGVISCHADE